jgi:hypothetical protein
MTSSNFDFLKHHDINSSTRGDALRSLQTGNAFSGWLHTRFGGDATRDY